MVNGKWSINRSQVKGAAPVISRRPVCHASTPLSIAFIGTVMVPVDNT